MLPTDLELSFAQKTKFDIFTVTNLAVVELAQDTNIQTRILAYVRKDLGNRDESMPTHLLQNPEVLDNLVVEQPGTP